MRNPSCANNRLFFFGNSPMYFYLLVFLSDHLYAQKSYYVPHWYVQKIHMYKTDLCVHMPDLKIETYRIQPEFSGIQGVGRNENAHRRTHPWQRDMRRNELRTMIILWQQSFKDKLSCTLTTRTNYARTYWIQVSNYQFFFLHGALFKGNTSKAFGKWVKIASHTTHCWKSQSNFLWHLSHIDWWE